MKELIFNYLHATLDLFNDMSFYLLLGFLIAGVLHVWFPKELVARYMGRKNISSVVKAALLGIPLPLCSCGVIPTGVSFYRDGASKGASVSFLIATPQTGVDSIMVTYSLLGLPFAVIRPIIALITGIFGGVVANRLDEKEVNPDYAIEEDTCEVEDVSKGKIYRTFNYAFGIFLRDIQKWLVIGILLAGLIAVLVPDDFFATHIHNSYLDMLILLVASVPLYVCATSSVPIAAVLLMKGLSPGAVLVFLMAGPATNIATMTVLGNVFGRKTLFAYMGTIIVGAFVFGALINEFLPASWFVLEGHGEHAGHAHHFLPRWLETGSSVLLALLLLNGFVRKYIWRNQPDGDVQNQSDRVEMAVEGMTCSHCEANVEKAISTLQGVRQVKADVFSGKVTVEGEGLDEAKIRDKIRAAGYEPDSRRMP